MSTFLKQHHVSRSLLSRGIKVFGAQDLQRLFGSSPTSTKYFLETQTRQGFLTRVKRAVYILTDHPPAEEELANALYRPSYISLEYALAFYNFLPEMPYTITSITTKPTRIFTTHQNNFVYHSIQIKAFTGYSLTKHSDRSFLIADPEKALVDYLYFESRQKNSPNERLLELVRGNLDQEKVLQYASLFENSTLTALISRNL